MPGTNFRHTKSGNISKKTKPNTRSKRKSKMDCSNDCPSTSTSAVLTPNTNRRTAGANWSNALNVSTGNENRETKADTTIQQLPFKTAQQQQQYGPQKYRNFHQRDEYVAMDCEMVGTGFNGRDDMLARVSIVNREGIVLLDKYVKPREAIIDYRTQVSGIRPSDLVNAEDFEVVQKEVRQIIQTRILVGHNVRKDLEVLHMNHPYIRIRDTSRYKPLSRLVSNGRTPSLKRLSEVILGIQIQTGEHNSVEDARAAMSIYNTVAETWEASLYTNQRK